MSCMFAPIPGGSPPQIFPIEDCRMDGLLKFGRAEILEMLKKKSIEDVGAGCKQFIGAGLRTDGTPFYMTTIAPKDIGREEDPEGYWCGGFYAPFGVADVVGKVECTLVKRAPIEVHVTAMLLPDPGGNPLAPVAPGSRSSIVEVEWTVHGNQATRANKGALIKLVKVIKQGPHNPDDIKRCVALHAPQHCFGFSQSVVAMQCGVAAACLVEAIC